MRVPGREPPPCGPFLTTDTTPADQTINTCNKIITLKVFSGEKLSTIYLWRVVGWNKKGDYTQVISDASEAIRLKPDQAIYNLRGSACNDQGEYEIAIADFKRHPAKSRLMAKAPTARFRRRCRGISAQIRCSNAGPVGGDSRAAVLPASPLGQGRRAGCAE